MQYAYRALLLSVCLLAIGRTATAQPAPPRYEFGADLSIASHKVDGVEHRFLTAGTPVDVRVGVLSDRPLSFETRFAMSYSSYDGNAAYFLRPGLHALWRTGAGAGPGNQLGSYATGGVAARIFGGSGPEWSGGSRFRPIVSVGVGHRAKLGPGALRMEAYVAHEFESGSEADLNLLPASTTIGVRVGISVWQ